MARARGLTAEEEADEFKRFIHPRGLAGVVGDDSRQALAEDALPTEAITAAGAAGAQVEADGHACHRRSATERV